MTTAAAMTGDMFGGSVYRDGATVLIPRSTLNTAPATGGSATFNTGAIMPFITPAQHAALIDANSPIKVTRHSGANGTPNDTDDVLSVYLNLGPADEAEFSFGGAGDTGTIDYWLLSVHPVYAASDRDRRTITGYRQIVRAVGAATLAAASTLGTEGKAVLDAATGTTDFVTTDLMATAITNTATTSDIQIDPGAAGAPAAIRAKADGAVAFRLVARRNTATAFFVVGRRTQGDAQN